MVTVAWNRTTVDTKNPQTSIWGPSVPSAGATLASSAPSAYRATASSSGTAVS